MNQDLNLVGLVKEVIDLSISSYNDTSEDTITGYFKLDFILSGHDKSEGYNLKKVYAYSTPLLAHAFPDNPLDILRGYQLEGISKDSIIIINGPLYCNEIEDFDGWSEYPLEEKSKPFPRRAGQGIFGTPFYYPSFVPQKIPTLKSAETAKAYINSIFLLNDSNFTNSYQKQILDDLRNQGMDKVKERYFYTI